MTDTEFIDQVRQVFHDCADYCENYLDENVEIDLYDDTLEIISSKNQIWLLNRHLATQEIWLSSPLTGAHHFRWHDAIQQWTTNRLTEKNIFDFLKNEFEKNGLCKI